MEVQATARDDGPVLDEVVKGLRNGGSSNAEVHEHAALFGCERPPKWRFKQRQASS